MGTVFQVPWARLQSWPQGTEGAGRSAETIDAADLAVKIPMRTGVDSLNVAARLRRRLLGASAPWVKPEGPPPRVAGVAVALAHRRRPTHS